MSVNKTYTTEELKEIYKQWVETFGLKSLDEDFIPKLPREIEALFEGGIHLKLGSLLKLIERDRVSLMSGIKEALENPDLVIEDKNAYIFVKDIGKEEVVFTSIAKTFENEMVVASNAYKKISTLKNKLDNGGVIIYQGAVSNILAETLRDGAFSISPQSSFEDKGHYIQQKSNNAKKYGQKSRTR